jgi:hypothetical protein
LATIVPAVPAPSIRSRFTSFLLAFHARRRGSGGSGSEVPTSDGRRGQFRPVCHAELGVDVCQVRLDVLRLIKRRFAISGFVRPSTASWTTSCSVEVRLALPLAG